MSDEHIEEGMSVQPKLYELGYLLAPLVASESVGEEAGRIKEIVGGDIKAEGTPVMQRLCYTISKHIGSHRHEFDSAYFGWVKFEATPEQMSTIKRTLDTFEMIVRYLLINAELTEADIEPILLEEPEHEEVSVDSALEVAQEAAAAVPVAPVAVKEEEKKEFSRDEVLDKEIDDLLQREQF